MKKSVLVLSAVALLTFGSSAHAIGNFFTPTDIRAAIDSRIGNLENQVDDLNGQLAALAAGPQTSETTAQQQQLQDQIATLNVMISQLTVSGQQGMAKLYGAITQFNLNVSPSSP